MITEDRDHEQLRFSSKNCMFYKGDRCDLYIVERPTAIQSQFYFPPLPSSIFLYVYCTTEKGKEKEPRYL
jgi:hypothetical protein